MNNFSIKCMIVCLAIIAVAVSRQPDLSIQAASPATLEKPKAGKSKSLADSATTPISQSHVTKESEMKPFSVKLRDTDVSFEMLPIPGGVFTMGSPNDEEGRSDDEGPQHKVKIQPFWMGKYEVAWDEYDVWRLCRDRQARIYNKRESDELDDKTDAVTRPTKEYQDMTFEMGHDGYPAICITQFAAQKYCEFLSEKTGHFYRLPTEAEWEYACRAGTTTAYSWGDDVDKINDYSWFYDNSNEKYHQVGKKKPNPWGLYDMHGNVAEWCLDRYSADFYKEFAGMKKPATFPHLPVDPKILYGRVVRGGGWDDDPDNLRSAARTQSEKFWKGQDPQLPQSMWWHTDATQIGFRVIRTLAVPSDKVKKEKFAAVAPDILYNEEKLKTICE